MSGATYLLPIISLIFGFAAQGLGIWLRVIDHPGGLKAHARPTPLVGGMAVLLPLVVYCGLVLWEKPSSAIHGALAVAVSGAFLLGYLDDRYVLTSKLRLCLLTGWSLLCIVVFPQFLVSELDFSFAKGPIALSIFAIIFSVLVIVGMTNAVNMADGIDGLICGLCIIWITCYIYYAPPELLELLILLTIFLCVTLVFNLQKRLFLGNSGAYGLGLLVCLLSIYIYNTSPKLLRADVVVAWFIVPVIDCLRLMVTRVLEGRFPTSADRNHLHHRLQRLLPSWAALVCYWLMVGGPGAVATLQPSLAPVMVLSVVVVYSAILLLSSDWVANVRGRPALAAGVIEEAVGRLDASQGSWLAGHPAGAKEQRKIILQSRDFGPTRAKRREKTSSLGGREGAAKRDRSA